jgi:hypothetical protein
MLTARPASFRKRAGQRLSRSMFPKLSSLLASMRAATETGYGLEELLAAWPELTKRIL